MKNLPKETTAFGKVNERDKVEEVSLGKKKKEIKANAGPDEVKKAAADEKKTVPAEEQGLRTDQPNPETVPRHD